MSEPGSPPHRARPLSQREQATIDHLERELDKASARAARVAVRRLERDLERDDPAFATMLRASADSPAFQTAASATIRAWIWILSLMFAVAVGVGCTAVIAATLGTEGLAVAGAALLVFFIGFVATVRFS